MAIYLYKDYGSGRTLEREFPMGEALPFITDMGIRFDRVFTAQIVMPETQTAAYWAGNEGNARMQRHMNHNKHIAQKVKEGSAYDVKPGEGQPREIFNDLERRIKE